MRVSARFFDFNGIQDLTESDEKGPNIQSFEFEAFKSFDRGSFQGEYSLGLRYFDIYEPYADGADVDYQGFGPVLGLEVTKEIGAGFSLYANTRVGYPNGEDDSDYVDDHSWTYQLGAGIEHDVSLMGLNGYVRLGAKVQHFTSIVYGNKNGNVAGGVFSLGLSF